MLGPIRHCSCNCAALRLLPMHSLRSLHYAAFVCLSTHISLSLTLLLCVCVFSACLNLAFFWIMLLHAFAVLVFICLRLSVQLSARQKCCYFLCALSYSHSPLPLTLPPPSSQSLLHSLPFGLGTPFGILLDRRRSQPIFTYFYYIFNTFSAVGCSLTSNGIREGNSFLGLFVRRFRAFVIKTRYK